MKGTFLVALIVVFSMLVIPLSTIDKSKNLVIPVTNNIKDTVYNKQEKSDNTEKIKVLKDGEVFEYGINDYVFGVVAAEMPALYEEEAIKAQTVAAYTFVCYKKETAQNAEYDISSDPQVAQCFITRQEAATRWGEKAQEYTNKIDACIKAVRGEVITYENKPIFAAYHAISAGFTNNSADVWGGELPYLKSVESTGDTFDDGFTSEVKLTSGDVAEKLKEISAAMAEEQNYFSNAQYNDAGYVKMIDYCGKQITGAQLAKLLQLRSPCFEISFSDGAYTFLVKGYGHGVGMSQTGANYMAQQGKTYKEILKHYYPETNLQKYKILLDK